MIRINLAISLLLLHTALQAQTPNLSSLSLEDIMKGDEFVGYSPRQIRWSEQSDCIYFQWRQAQDTVWRWYQWEIGKQIGAQVVSDSLIAHLPIGEGQYNLTRSQKIYERDGDIYWYDVRKQRLRPITQTQAYEHSPRFSSDEQKIFFISDNNLFSWEIATGAVQQWTNFQKGNAPNPSKPSPAEQYLREEEARLFPHLNERDPQGYQRKGLLPIYLQENSLQHVQISPDERFITFRLSRYSNSNATEYPQFITESGYAKSNRARAKVGTSQLLVSQLGIYDRQRDTVYYIANDQIPDIFKKPTFLREYAAEGSFDSFYTVPREVVYHPLPFSKKGLFVLEIKALDNKDRWLMQVDLPTGALRLIDQQHDEAWIGGPGIENWDESPGNTGWLADGETLFFQSEKTGFSHLYTEHLPSKTRRALTQGQYEVHEAFLSNDKTAFYLVTSEADAGEQQLYRMDTDGKNAYRITTAVGQHRPTVSPDERWIADLYSYSNQPWDLFLVANKKEAESKRLTDSRSEAFKKYAWRDPQLVYFDAEDGAKVRARLYLPDADKRNGAGVIFVHGAGYLQNAHKGWSYYLREFMFHNLLADNGYTVLDIDYRGSAGYGRDWRTGIYRHMGGKDLSDQVDGARYLIEKQGVKSDKIGIYGGSYGGFITLMALFTRPGTFQCGAALRSVTDWAHYNQPYTRDILNLPVEDSLAYRRSSPIYHAEGLKDRLLMLHGILDDNVQFQDIIRLSQRLMDLKKENWELAVYPVEAHGFVRTTSWLDEYRRIFKLFQEELR